MSKRPFLIFTWYEKKKTFITIEEEWSLCYAMMCSNTRIPPANRARRRCIRNEMRMKRDTPLIAIKMDTNGHRRGRNRQIKRVTSKTPKSCRKTTSWSWCVKGEDQLARCAKNKLRVHHKAAIKSIKSHSEKIIATFPAPFSHEKLPISVNFSQNVRKIFAKFSPNFRTHFPIWKCRFFVKL